jgi:hypothetical protein
MSQYSFVIVCVIWYVYLQVVTPTCYSSRFVWPHMASYLNRWSRECLPCQKAKIVRD